MSSLIKSLEVNAAEWKRSAGRSPRAMEELERSDERQLARTGKSLLYFQSGLQNGGPAGLIYSYILSWLGVVSVMSCLASLASMAPTAAGQYYWVSILAPKGLGRIMSYVTVHPPTSPTSPYIPNGYQSTTLLWAAVLLALCINTSLAKYLPKIEGVILYIHLLGFFAILVSLLHLSNRGEWPSMGIAWLVDFCFSTVTNVGSLGGDCAVHMSEEIHSASRIVPWNILLTLSINGLLGFGMLIATLSVSPILRARFGRDFGLPFSEKLAYVSPKSLLPTNAIICTFAIPFLLGLIVTGSSIALLNLLSFVTSSRLLAAALPLDMLFWRRTTGLIKDTYPSSKNASLEYPLVWGPWRIPEPFGTIINIFGLCWIRLAVFFGFWPPMAKVTVNTMNFSSAMTGFWLIFGVVWFAVWGNRTYKGPVDETK
ncbi:hypothetical protein K469DRAFT_735070 [Zopfia rhizophila CBS 207.26]|uniref:Amino acid transporter n=1 Tax=Zopfia rhizophila CBS 207.26 TaxID=1314779 RepID=A0A6A6EQA7_9PEZI|nr:hypothetical protein K469DRAFT_735070 [Zopfia rhizophila CBS 207.26]